MKSVKFILLILMMPLFLIGCAFLGCPKKTTTLPIVYTSYNVIAYGSSKEKAYDRAEAKAEKICEREGLPLQIHSHTTQMVNLISTSSYYRQTMPNMAGAEPRASTILYFSCQ